MPTHMIRSNSTMADDASIEAQASGATRTASEKRHPKSNDHASSGSRLDEQFQDCVGLFAHDPVSCGHAAADFVRRHQKLTATRATYLICLNVGKRRGAAIAAFAAHMSSATRPAIFRTALQTQPIEDLSQFARDLMTTVPERLQSDVRDDLVVSASEVLGPDGLHNLSFGLGFGRSREIALPKLVVDQTTEGGQFQSEKTQRNEDGPNWAVLLTVFGSAAFFLLAFLALAVWLVSLL